MNLMNYFYIEMLNLPLKKIIHNFHITNQNQMNQSFTSKQKNRIWKTKFEIIILTIFYFLGYYPLTSILVYGGILTFLWTSIETKSYILKMIMYFPIFQENFQKITKKNETLNLYPNFPSL